ncbi:carbohydrate ABC transporter permease [Paenibacillus sp. PAMC21692]|uniref:carbohydrate ABC transporter permease n=1 Tax=Paenibacillus sp. PAMC21692 TaxID=2762320 RepID=UPI00164D21DB|nr:carbohydrate ABC transporter permease [Paenibacillus sp. PAMC21692]QNK59519.1 carbohydrate ABC transporter permease [Paenibacillus sp. PAMC21692]
MAGTSVNYKQMLEKYKNRNFGQRYGRKMRTLLMQMLTYLVLLELSFIFLLPVFYMFVTAIKSPQDLLDSTIVWVPSGIHWDNFVKAFNLIKFTEAVTNSLMITVLACLGQVLSCAIAGYGFGRYKFPGINILFLLVLLSLLIPPQTIIIALFTMFHKFGWLNSYLPFIIPAFFGQGLRGALFVLIFRQFFRNMPRELEEAARIDGAGPIRLFVQIMLPLAKPAIVIVAMFSFVWHWNDNYQPMIYLNREEYFTLPLRLESLSSVFNRALGLDADGGLNLPIHMAACLMVVLPVFILYLFGQRYLSESIERTGFGGE